MRIPVLGDVDISRNAFVAVQVTLVLLTAGFAVFLYGTMGPLLRQRAALQTDIAQMGEEEKRLHQQRRELSADKERLEGERNRLRDEIKRLSADRDLLTASVRTLSSGGDRAVSVVESTAAASDTARPISPRIYVHVSSDPSAERARAMVADLERAGFIVPSVARVRAVPGRPQLRVFTEADKAVADSAFEIVRRFVPDIEIRRFERTDLPNLNSRAMRPGHLELWF